MRWTTNVPLLMFGVLAIVFAVVLMRGGASTSPPSPLIGKPVPAFALPALPLDDSALNGDQAQAEGLTTAMLSGEGLTVVNFWASWCAPCRVEHPVLMDLARRPGMRVVGIAYKDEPDAARGFLRALGNPFERVALDLSGRTAIEWGVSGVPETFLVSPDGTVLARHVGPLEPDTWAEQLPPASLP